MWGQVRSEYFRSMTSRIIPTRVGTSTITQTVYIRCGDHPHACGDKKKVKASSCHGKGSSPRVWGQETSLITYSIDNRIIPTRVGTRGFLSFAFCVVKDHPHACGDKAFHEFIRTQLLGSSPRVWGQGKFMLLFLQYLRIIPTRVGTR